MKQIAFVSLHLLSGSAALVLAVYFLFSSALVMGPEFGLTAMRPRLTVFAIFAVAACCLLVGSRRPDLGGRRMLGYLSLCLGIATIWLIFEGSQLESVETPIAAVGRSV